MKTKLISGLNRSLCAFWLLATFSSALAQSIYTYDAPGNLVTVSPAPASAPTILSQPTTPILGTDTTATFTVVAGGTGPFTYQWLSNGVPVSGANGDTLVITNVTTPQNVISNGSFESPAVIVNYITHPAGDNLSGWIVESGNADHIFSAWWAAEGMQSIDLNGTVAGSIYEDVPTVPGQQYYLRFALSGNPGNLPNIKTNEVWWGTNKIDTTAFSVVGHSTLDMGWTNHEYLVAATTNNTRVRFVSLSTGAYGPAIDNVSLFTVPPSNPAYSVVISNSTGSVTSSVVTIEFDTDGNGLPDSWERTYFGNTAQDALADSDNDGISNLDEYREGTNPTNTASVNPRLNLAISGNGSIGTAPLKTFYLIGENVQLTALADDGNNFLGWFGAVTNTNAVVNLTMDSTKSVTALFGITLSNGISYQGTLPQSTTNYYAFNGNAGESFVLSIGEVAQDNTSFYPMLYILNPNGTQIASGNGIAGIYLTGRLTNSGLFKVMATSFYNNGSGSYRLKLAKAPGAFGVSNGDEGGTLTNGLSHIGSLPTGDLDMWSFNANVGDGLMLEIGEITQSNANFYPQLLLYSPNGTLIGTDNGAAAASLSLRATNSGTFTAVANSFYPDGAGTYRLSLAQAPAVITTAPGDDGGTLSNGAMQLGGLPTGDLDVWNFVAAVGDTITLRMGEITQTNGNFYPQLTLYNPGGAVIANNTHASDAYVSVRATNSGTFTAVANSYYNDGPGTYRITLAKMPGIFAVSPSDEGGDLINGGNHDGTIDMGDEDMWRFTANAKETIILRCGDTTSVGSSPTPWIRLYGPDGAFLSENANASDAYVSYQTTNGGTFTALVGSYYPGYAGTYRLHFVKVPGDYTVPVGDEGGLITRATAYNATNEIGDEDIWSFTAYKSAPITLVAQRTVGSASYLPWLRLYGYNGLLLASVATATSTINYTPTNNGTFTLVIGSFYQGYNGSYRLSATNVSDMLKLFSPTVSGTNFNLTGSGGASNVLFVLSSTTNLAQPFALWTPLWTNRFDTFGTFAFTNLFNPLQREQYFRLMVP